MTIEQAIKILDPATSIATLAEVEYYAGFHGNFAKIEAYNEACDLAVKVMKAVQEKWHSQSGVQCRLMI